MKTCSVCKVEKPPTAFHKKVGGRLGVGDTCKACRSAQEQARYSRNRDNIRTHQRAFYAANKDAFRERNRKWREQNRDWLREYEKDRAAQAYLKNWIWREQNRERWRALMSDAIVRRKRARNRATPVWANRRAMQDMYALAQLLTKETSISHHVDHIVPLVSPLVCGLHVEYNLRVITAAENLSKSNRFEVETTQCPPSSPASSPTA